MKRYQVELERAHILRRTQQYQRAIIWGFSPNLEQVDNCLLKRLIQSTGGTDVLVLTRGPKDVLIQWPHVHTFSPDVPCIVNAETWILLTTVSSESFHAFIKDAWSANYAASTYVVAADIFGLGVWAGAAIAKRPRLGLRMENNAGIDLVNAVFRVGWDGECLIVEKWRDVAPANWITALQAICDQD